MAKDKKCAARLTCLRWLHLHMHMHPCAAYYCGSLQGVSSCAVQASVPAETTPPPKAKDKKRTEDASPKAKAVSSQLLFVLSAQDPGAACVLGTVDHSGCCTGLWLELLCHAAASLSTTASCSYLQPHACSQLPVP